MIRSSTVRKGLFAAGVLAAMGFGTAQAFAAPTAPATTTICEDTYCYALCIAKGYHYGYCWEGHGCVCHRLGE